MYFKSCLRHVFSAPSATIRVTTTTTSRHRLESHRFTVIVRAGLPIQVAVAYGWTLNTIAWRSSLGSGVTGRTSPICFPHEGIRFVTFLFFGNSYSFSDTIGSSDSFRKLYFLPFYLHSAPLLHDI